VPAILVYAWRSGSRAEFQMMVAAMILTTFNTVFWTLFEQAGLAHAVCRPQHRSVGLRPVQHVGGADAVLQRAVHRHAGAAADDFVGQAGLARARTFDPDQVRRGADGRGRGLPVPRLGTRFAGPDFKVSIWWLAGLYLIHSLAELCISPVGMSMITKLSLTRIVGLMMGVWYLSIAMAQYVAGIVAQVASVATVGGEVTNLKLSLDTYTGVFTVIGWIAVGIGVVLLALSGVLKKLMHGVR
jgi:POT family proton-dependent oligopeptide transporter